LTAASIAADLALMGRESFGGAPNDTRGTSDEGRTQFNIGRGYQGHVDSSGVLERVHGASWNTYLDRGSGGGAANQAAYTNAWARFPHRAGGGRMDGSPSSIDSILAWLAPGEHVIDANTTASLDRKYGRNWAKQLAQMVIPMQRPHFASGGRVDGGSSSDRATAMLGGNMKIIAVNDWKAAIKEAQKDDSFRTLIVDTVKGAAHEIGIGAING
jgi:hypothetical protein